MLDLVSLACLALMVSGKVLSQRHYITAKDSNISEIFQILFEIFQILLKHSFQKNFEIFESTARFRVWRSSEQNKVTLKG